MFSPLENRWQYLLSLFCTVCGGVTVLACTAAMHVMIMLATSSSFYFVTNN
jgi:hypothetical protein